MSHDAGPGSPPRELQSEASPWLLQTLDNDLGERFLSFDDDGVMVESLRVRGDLAAHPPFAAALRQRLQRLPARTPWLAPVRLLQDDGQGGLTVRAEAGDATRLRDLVSHGASDPATASALLEQALYCASLLHRCGPDVAHGAITLDRLALTADGHLRLLDCAFGAALASLDRDDERLFEELAIVRGGRALDQSNDVLQCALACLELMRGSPLVRGEWRDPDGLMRNVDALPGPALASWLRRALGAVDHRFADAREALSALQPLLPGTAATRAALVAGLAMREAHPPVVEALGAACRAPEAQNSAAEPILPPIVHTTTAPAARELPWATVVPGWPPTRMSAAIAAIVLLAGVVVFQALYIVRQATPVAVTIAPPSTVAAPLPAPAVPAMSPPVAAAIPAVVATGGESRPAPVPASRASEAPGAVLRAGWLSIRAPFELDVYSNDQLIGTSRSSRIMLPDGRHSLLLVSEALGFRTAAEVTIVGGRSSTFDVVVPTGVLHVNASPWATVTIDGESYGETPLGNLKLPLGAHEVVFRHPDFGERRQTVVITSGTPARLSVDFRP